MRLAGMLSGSQAARGPRPVGQCQNDNGVLREGETIRPARLSDDGPIRVGAERQPSDIN